ncbi:hypothetical protein [Polaromonas sp. UBA4122]|uniref:hypothetical protein n=1 Tax=Polaromonas sp. UBA4122 TaxID=1947074 RepID=UPI0025FBF480|nr:hypothetical protein [Polaromonas sp. UBA4122]
MSRNLDNLKKLFQELQVRYGADDPMVLQVKQELEGRQAIESLHPGWPVTDRRRSAGKATEHHGNAVSGG